MVSTNRIIKQIFFLLFSAIPSFLISQSLTAGDIAFTSYNTDSPDNWSFVVLEDIPSGETIKFTDRGWTGAAFYVLSNEDTLVVTTTSTISAGTVVEVSGTTFTPSIGSVSGTNLSLFAGDQVLCYQGPDNNPTFIAAIHGDYNSGDYNSTTKWNNSATDNTTSSILPAGLTNGTNAIALFPGTVEIDNARYNCTLTSGTKTDLLNAINDYTNWVSDNSATYSAACTSSFTVSASCSMTASITAQTNVGCNGESTGSLTVTQSSGTSNFDYAWSNGATTSSSASSTNTITSLSATTYTVTVTDDNGCTATASSTVTQPASALVASAAVSSTIDCNGDTDGQLTGSATGGTSPYTYNWNTGETAATETNLGAGTYSVTVTDQNGCTDSASETLTQPTALVASAAVSSTLDCNGDTDGQVTASQTGGTAGYTYNWNTGETNATETGLGAGTYSVTITDANGCTDSGSTTLTEPTALVASASVSTALDCNGDTDGAMTASPSGGTSPYTYSWNTGGTSQTETNLGAGTYSVTITDQNGCTDSASGTLTEPTALVASAAVSTALDCNGDTDGAMTASPSGGTSPYTYSWNTGGTSATETGLGAGTYSVTVTDQNGCTDSASGTLTEPTALVASAAVSSTLDCNGDTDGQVTASQTGGTSGYTYNWNTGETNATETGLGAGTYSVTITDANGCTDSGSTTLTQPTALVASAAVSTALDCNGDTDGQVTASQTGGTSGYTYNWNTGETNATETGLGAGTYSVTITDANGCTDSGSTTLTEPTALVASASVSTALDCNGDTDGAMTASPSGGTSPYTYSWNTGGTSATETGLGAGTYSITVTDQNGCTDSASGTLTEPTALVANSVVDSNSTCGASDGGATAGVSGGASPYTYLWSNTATTASITGITAGTYSVTITDNNGCTDSASSTITTNPGVTASSVVDSNATCNGLSDGGATASGSGGATPYTYLWSNTATTASITGVAAGTYSVTITDNNGCTDSGSSTITEPASLVAATVVDSNVSCNGISDGGMTASATGGTAAYTYSWSNGATTASITGVAAGTYSVTITDANGCTDSASGTVTEPAALVAASVVDSNASCNGLSDGGMTASATGGTAAYTYSWSNGATTASITGVAAGTYSVTITDANGCTDSGSSAITEPASLVAASVVDSNASCNGLSDGGATASATGGTMPYSYLWSNTATTASITGVAAGTYSVTITDANGCTDSGSSTITEPASLVAASVVDSNASCNGLSDGGATASATGGTMPYSYLWSNTATTASITGVAAGTYSVTITDNNGCTDSGSSTITEPASLVAASVVDSNVTCNGLSDGGLTASATGGTAGYNYTWSNGATTASITGVAAGTYSVTITDANGCTDSGSSTITEPASLVAASVVDSNVTCNGLSDGGLTASATGGTMPYSYLWSNTATTASITGVSAGTYSVTITDANGCTDSGSSAITEPASLVAALVVDSNASCNGLSDGGATASATGGTMPYSYLWSNTATTASITGVAAGTYSVTITDANGCTDSGSSTITEPASLVAATVVDSNASCNGLSDGGATASATGGTMPYSYLWSNTATTASITGVSAGTYTVTITDNNGCTSTSSSTVTEPATLIAATVADSMISCNGLSDGGATASATGGTMPYAYTWSNSATSTSITGVTAGTYSVTVTDNNGCTSQTSVTITQPATLFTQTNVASTINCYGGNDGQITSTTTGGTTPYSYNWSTGATTSSISNVSVGAYTVTVTDANGCTLTRTQTIAQPDSLSSTFASTTDVSCNGGNDGSIDLSVTGGTTPYTFNWSNAATTEDLSAIAAGTYTVTITDANGCTLVKSTTITEPDALATDNISVDNVSCNGGNDGSIVIDFIGGTEPYNYLWSTGSIATNATGLMAGTYTVTVSDDNGCTITVSETITEPTLLTAAASLGNEVTCHAGNDGSASATSTGGTAPVTYAWSNGSTGEDLTGVIAGTYTVTVTDNNGCTATDVVSISEPTAITASIAVDSNVTCNSLADGGLTASATGGTGNLSFAWSNGANTAEITGIAAGTYTVTVTDDNGCTEVLSEVITEPVTLTASAAVDSNVTCATLSDGGATVTPNGGTAPYSYQWTNSATTAYITGVTANTYTVTVTDNNGCSATTNVTIGEPNALLLAIDTDSTVTCNGLANGGVTARASEGTAPYNFAWSTGETTVGITQLIAGTYSVTITDANGCTISDDITMTEPVLLSASAVVDSTVTCNGLADGGATVTANGGTAPYTYDWSNGDNTASIDGLAAGVYTVEVTDANGCTDEASISISEPTALNMTTAIEDAIDCYGQTGEISASADGGTRPYSYNWSNGATTIINSNVEVGTYTVTVTDANGCSLVRTQNITQPDSLTLTAVIEPEQFQGDGRIDLTVTGGTGTYVYDWDNDQAGDFDDNQDQNTLPTGDYQVIVQDVNGCRDTATYFVGSNVSTLPILESAEVNVFPTPTTGILNIEHDGLIINQIFIYSMEGKVVYQSNTGLNQINISNLERATYFMEIHTDKGVVQKRIIRR